MWQRTQFGSGVCPRVRRHAAPNMDHAPERVHGISIVMMTARQAAGVLKAWLGQPYRAVACVLEDATRQDVWQALPSGS